MINIIHKIFTPKQTMLKQENVIPDNSYVIKWELFRNNKKL
jgi:hypothetical protein